MTDKPIIFSAPMVRSLLDGRKTQTRRVLKPQPQGIENRFLGYLPGRKIGFTEVHAGGGNSTLYSRLPYASGDRLWVRERFSGLHRLEGYPPSQWMAAQIDTYDGLEIEEAAPIWYWADGNPTHGDWTRPRPSIHMPRWASRLTLTVTDVRVQRLQEISAKDVQAEGICARRYGDGATAYGWNGSADHITPRTAYRFLWNSLHAIPKPVKGADGRVTSYVSYPWESVFETRTHRGKPWNVIGNPWIVALTFTVHRCNIDRMEAA